MRHNQLKWNACNVFEFACGDGGIVDRKVSFAGDGKLMAMDGRFQVAGEIPVRVVSQIARCCLVCNVTRGNTQSS